jgi:hypothetical protein
MLSILADVIIAASQPINTLRPPRFQPRELASTLDQRDLWEAVGHPAD